MDNITAGVESKEGHGTAKQAGIVLESDKLTKLLKTSDTVQDIVAAWAQLQRDVENSSSPVVPSPLDHRRGELMVVVVVFLDSACLLRMALGHVCGD